MSALLHMNVPPTYALAAIAVALGMSVGLGPAARPEAAPPPAPRTAGAVPAHEGALPLDKLERPGLGEPLANLFATPPAARAPRAAHPVHPAPPPAPVAPPLPFRFLGRYVDGERSVLYLARGDEPFLAAPGAQLGPDYRVAEVSPQAVTLVYLPLGTRQQLPLPAPQ